MSAFAERNQFMAKDPKQSHEDTEHDSRLRCSWCRLLIPTVEQREERRVGDGAICLCEQSWLPHQPPVPPEPSKPVKG